MLRESLFLRSRERYCRRPRAYASELFLYRRFIIAAGMQLGELLPVEGESIREVRALIRAAAWGMGLRIRTWIDEGKVYFYVIR